MFNRVKFEDGTLVYSKLSFRPLSNLYLHLCDEENIVRFSSFDQTYGFEILSHKSELSPAHFVLDGINGEKNPGTGFYDDILDSFFLTVQHGNVNGIGFFSHMGVKAFYSEFLKFGNNIFEISVWMEKSNKLIENRMLLQNFLYVFKSVLDSLTFIEEEDEEDDDE